MKEVNSFFEDIVLKERQALFDKYNEALKRRKKEEETNDSDDSDEWW